jgi:hypothetical protein
MRSMCQNVSPGTIILILPMLAKMHLKLPPEQSAVCCTAYRVQSCLTQLPILGRTLRSVRKPLGTLE